MARYLPDNFYPLYVIVTSYLVVHLMTMPCEEVKEGFQDYTVMRQWMIFTGFTEMRSIMVANTIKTVLLFGGRPSGSLLSLGVSFVATLVTNF